MFRVLGVLFGVLLAASQLAAADPPSAVSSVLKLLKSGKVPPARMGSVVEMICTRGNEHDLAFVFEQVADEKAYAADLRRKALTWLKEAAVTRKTVPVDRSALAKLLDPATNPDVELQLHAIELAEAWKNQASAKELGLLAREASSTQEIRDAALSALVVVDAATAKSIAQELLAEGQPFPHRALGVATLSSLDLPASAAAAAIVLKSAQPEDDPAPIIDALLDREGGAAALGEALKSAPLPQDVAKLSLRRVYAAGRSDAALIDVLAPQAGVSAKPVKLTKEEVAALASAAEKGDPARGELVFRRSDLSCMKCHAVSKAGGQIGPDLSAVGANSPMDYLVTALFDPDAQIKEAFVTKVVTTIEGRVFQGIAVDRTDEKLTLRNTDGKLIEIPVADIDEEVEGKSLMPKGLPTLLTEAETLDLLKFLSVLGRPGDYSIRATQRFQRWRLLAQPKPELLAEIPNLVIFETEILDQGKWGSAYGLVNGNLPLAEIAQSQKSERFYLQGEVEVVEAGPVTLQFDSVEGLTVWVGKETLASPQGATVELTPGRHPITLRVDTQSRPSQTLKLELTRQEGASTQFQVVDGQ
jgi:putative heme-binding domain-containing protein